MENLISLYKNGKLSHINLIETNNQVLCGEQIIPLLRLLSCSDAECMGAGNCNLCYQIENGESLNIFIVKSEEKNIKKEAIRYIQEKCSLMPVVSENNIYIIYNAEKLTTKTSNMMLKFIEEPFDNCYGFLITNNKENVINTIRSRCEIYTINFDDDKNLYSEEVKIKATEYVEKLENSDLGIIINQDFFSIDQKKIDFLEPFFKYIYEVYTYYLRNSEDSNYNELIFLQKISKENIIKKINIVNEVISNLKYNLNVDLMLDRFIIEMGESNE